MDEADGSVLTLGRLTGGCGAFAFLDGVLAATGGAGARGFSFLAAGVALAGAGCGADCFTSPVVVSATDAKAALLLRFGVVS